MNDKQIELKIQTDKYLQEITKLIGHENFSFTLSIHNLPNDFFTDESEEIKYPSGLGNQYKKCKHQTIRLEDKKIKNIDMYSESSLLTLTGSEK